MSSLIEPGAARNYLVVSVTIYVLDVSAFFLKLTNVIYASVKKRDHIKDNSFPVIPRINHKKLAGTDDIFDFPFSS